MNSPEIAPGIYWLDGGASNMYLCQDEAGLVLVDAGMPKRQRLVLEAIEALGCEPNDLKYILVTHADLDHVGSLAALQASTGSIVCAGAATAGLICHGQAPKHMPWLVQFIIDNFMRYQPIDAANVREVEDGLELDLLGGVEVLATPGHTMDHVAYFCRTAGVLFAGDALNTRKGRLQMTPRRITADMAAATQSAVRLLEKAPAVLACGHGPPLSHHSSEDLMQLFNALRRA